MHDHLLNALAFGGPLLLGLAALVVGVRQVRLLRRRTGANTTLTKVLSASFDELARHKEAA